MEWDWSPRPDDMADASGAIVIAVGNLKGGVGKTTLTVNLAAAIAQMGWSVVVIDTDPQQSAARWGLGGRLPCEVMPVPIRDVTDARVWVSAVVAMRTRPMFVIIDLPAVLDAALAAACMLADTVVVPTPPAGLDVAAIDRTLELVEMARRERRDAGPLVHFVPTKVPRRGFLVRRPDFGRLGDLELPLLPPIYDDVDHRRAVDARKWIGAFAPRSSAHRDVVAVTQAILEALGRRGRLPSRVGARAGGKAAGPTGPAAVSPA